MGRRPGRAQGDVVVETWRRVEGIGQWLGHGVLNSVVPEQRTRATEVKSSKGRSRRHQGLE